MTLLARLVLILTMLVATPAGAQAPATSAAPLSIQRTERIEAELVGMTAWVAPGSTAIVAVRQKIRPGWHTYWRNPGDSGGATTLDWRLPADVVAGDIVWPLPERQRLAGLMNYGYSDTVYLPVPIEIPATVAAGARLPLSVTALFLVCSAEMCVPDELVLPLTLVVRDEAPALDPVHGSVIQRIVETAPRPAPIDATARLEDGALRLDAVGGPLENIDPGPAYFFPYQGGIIDHAAAQSGEWGPRGLTLRLTPGGASAGGVAGPIRGVLETADGAYEITAEPGPALSGTTGQTLTPATTDDPARGDTWTAATFLQAALFALLGGLILNLMPCVFPILAMKAAALTASASEPAHARRDGLAFLAGVLTTFILLASILIALRAAGEAAGWGFQLQSPAVVAGLTLLMLAVGLNLSGVFHVGGALQGAGATRLGRTAGGGAFFTGVLAVLVAAPCTAPFMAFALGAALVMPWPLALTVFLMLGLGLALPYVAVSQSPGLLRRLPKPGPWMERLRNVLAFPMYATALWLAWVFSRQVGADALALLFGAALLVAFGLWLAGRAQADRALGGTSVASGIAASTVLPLGLGLLTYLMITTAAKPETSATNSSDRSGNVASAPWSPQAVQTALAQGRPVLVNFTADWCVTCKINERTSLASSEVREAVTAENAVYLVGDWTRRDDVIAAELERHGRSGVPLYLVYGPGRDDPRILPQLLTPGLVADALKDAAPET